MATTNNTTPRGAFVSKAAIGGVGLTGTDYVQEGVVNNAGLYAGQVEVAKTRGDMIDTEFATSAVRAAGDATQFLVKTAVSEGLRRDTQDAIDEYIDNINVEQHAVDATAYNNMSDSLWAGFGKGDSSRRVADISAVEANHQKSLGKVKRAYQQGAITSLAELESRVLKITREAVNRTPGLSQEIMQHTQTMLHLSGVRGMQNPMIKQQEQAAKQQDYLNKQMISYAKSNHIPVDFQNPDYGQLNKDINQHMQDHAVAQQHKEAVAAGEKLEKHQMKDYFTQVFPSLSRATYDDVNTAAIEEFSNEGEYSSQLVRFKNRAEAIKHDLTMQMTQANAFADPQGVKLHKMSVDAIDNVISNVEKFKSGDEAAKYINNATNMQKDIELSNVMKRVNITAVNVANALDPNAAMRGKKLFAPMVENTMRDLLGMSMDPSVFDGYNIKDGVNDAAAVTGGMILANQPEDVTKAMSNIANAAKEDPSMSNKVVKLTETFRELGNSRYKGKILNPDYAFDSSFLKGAEVYLDGVGRMLKVSVDEANSSLGFSNSSVRSALPYLSILGSRLEKPLGVAASQEVRPVGKILKNGFLDYSVENDTPAGKYQVQYKKDIADRVNDVIKTYMNVMGVSSKEASDLVISKYGHMLGVPQEDIPQPPKSLTSRVIKKEEGFSSSAYEDSAGVPTIGYGFTKVAGVPVKKGDRITREQADEELIRQIPKYQNFKKIVTIDVSPQQEAALTSFEYNLGSGVWEGDRGKKIINLLNSGEVEQAGALMRTYRKARDKLTGEKKQIQGLVNRRMREYILLSRS